MFDSSSLFDTIGRLLIVGFFVVAGLWNVTRAQAKDHIERLAEKGIPMPALAFWFAISVQFIGCALILANWHAKVGVWCLIVFTIVASAIFLRFWTMSEPMRRNVRLRLMNNVAVVGGLFLLLQNVS